MQPNSTTPATATLAVDRSAPVATAYLALAVALCGMAAAVIADQPRVASLFLWSAALAVVLRLYRGRVDGNAR